MDRMLQAQTTEQPDAHLPILDRQSLLETAAELVRVTGARRELNDLLTTAAQFIRERLGLAFVGILLLDEAKRSVVLRAGAGEIGQPLVLQGYQLSLADDSAVALALASERPVLVRRGISIDQPFAGALLPITAGAAVIPLRGRGEMLGVWTAHTDVADGFDPNDEDLYALVGDNLAAAIENGELFTRQISVAGEMELAPRAPDGTRRTTEPVSQRVVYSRQADSFGVGATEPSEPSVPSTEGADTSAAMSVPISLRGQVIGTVDLYDVTQPRRWNENEQALVTGVVEQLALAVENARLFQQAEQRARETQIINELASAISGELDQFRLFETVYRYLPRLMPTDAFIVWLYDDQTHTVTRPALYDLGEYFADDQGPREPAGSVALVVSSRGPIAVNNTRQEWERERHETALIIGSSEPSASRLYVPLRVGNRLRGVISVQTYTFDAYGSPQVALLTNVANTIATALENAQLFAETNTLFHQAQQALAETRLLYSTSGQLNQVSSLEELVRIAAQPAFAQGAGSAQLLLMEYQGRDTPFAANVMVSLVSPGVPTPLSQYTHFAIDQYTLGQTMLANPRELVIIEDVQSSPILDEATRFVLLQSKDLAVILMPLTVEQRVLGAIAIGWSAPHRFTDQERRIYQSLAGQLALVLNNRLLFEQTEQALAETQTLYEISARLNAANSLQESLEAASGPAIVQGASNAALLQVLVEADGTVRDLETVALWPRNSDGGFPINSRFGRENIAGDPTWMDNPFEPMLIQDLETDERVKPSARETYSANKIRATALLPLKLGERWVGLLSLNWQEPHPFTPREARLFRSIMAQTATVLDNRRAEQAVRQQNAYLTALHDTTLGLMRRLNLEELLQNIITRAAELVGTEHGYVHLIEPNGAELRMRIGIGIYHDFVGTIVKPGQGLAGTVWSNQEAIVVDDYRRWPGRLPMVDRDVLRAVAGVPLKSGTETVGVLGLASLSEGRRFAPAQVEALARFAELAAVALDNAQLYDATRQALEQTQRVAQREKSSSEIADKLYAAPDVKTVLRTAAEELCKSTGSRRAIVRLNLGGSTAPAQENGKHEPNGH